jgi:hypothetical protein
MIKTIQVYDVDGKRFDNYDDAVVYDKICCEVNHIMSQLTPRNTKVDDCIEFITHDPNAIKTAWTAFMEICKDLFPEKTHLFDICIKRGYPMNDTVTWLIGDISQTYPIIYNTYYRFRCTNFVSGKEYCQPYYAKHEEEFDHLRK